MATFDIKVEICLGFSHSGGVYNSAYGIVEFSDKEVEQLVNLMRIHESSDPEDLDLENSLPEIYAKLKEAHEELAYQAEKEHWLDEGYYRPECHNYEDEDMIKYLKDQDAWDFEYDEEEFKDEKGNLDEEALFDAECEYLHDEALDNYLHSLDEEERYDFIENRIGIDVDCEGCDYEINIPADIVSIAFPDQKSKP